MWFTYNYIFNEIADPRTRGFLFESPISLICVLICYVLVVKKIGPAFMAKRQAYKIDKLLISYNIAQICINCYLFVALIPHVSNANVLCSEVGKSDSVENKHILHITKMFYFLKMFDTLDTVFFVLRKKFKQVSLLHVYHHCSMLHATWTALKYVPGGHTMFAGFINSFVHAVMFSYYLVTVYNPEYGRSLWWKKYITQLQLLQFFCAFLIYFPMLFLTCSYPKILAFILVVQNGVITCFFVKFYYKNYIKKTT